MACVSFWLSIRKGIQMACGVSWLTYDSVVKDDTEEVLVSSMYFYNQATLISRIWFDLKFDLASTVEEKTETWVIQTDFFFFFLVNVNAINECY